VIQNVEELRGVGCQAPNSQDLSVVSEMRKLLIGPRWTWDPSFEKPSENRDMGTWNAAVYSKDQQQRLHVNEWGHSVTETPKAHPDTDSSPKSALKIKPKSKSQSAFEYDPSLFRSTRSLRTVSNKAINSFGKKHHHPATDDYYFSMPIPDVTPGLPYDPEDGGGPPTSAPTYIEYPPGEVVPIPPRRLVDEFDWSQMRGKGKGKGKGKDKGKNQDQRVYTAPASTHQADSLNTFGAFSGGDGSDDGEYSYRFEPPKSKAGKRQALASDQ
jgi:hypothetical protein